MKTSLKRRSPGAARSRTSTRPPSRNGNEANPALELIPSLLKIRSILVPTDFSPESGKALTYARQFARQFGSKLLLMHVVELGAAPDFARAFPLAIESGHLLAEGRVQLERFARDTGVEPALLGKIVVRCGSPFLEISEAARRLKADLIIIATRGRTGWKHALLGSTSERVVRHAPCPVLVVRPGEREFA